MPWGLGVMTMMSMSVLLVPVACVGFVMLLGSIRSADHKRGHQTNCIKHMSTPFLILRLE